MVEEGGLHAGPVAIRGGVPVVQAADQPTVEGKGGDGQGAEEVFHVGRHQAEEGPEIPACEKRVRNIRENFEKRRRAMKTVIRSYAAFVENVPEVACLLF